MDLGISYNYIIIITLLLAHSVDAVELIQSPTPTPIGYLNYPYHSYTMFCASIKAISAKSFHSWTRSRPIKFVNDFFFHFTDYVFNYVNLQLGIDILIKPQFAGSQYLQDMEPACLLQDPKVSKDIHLLTTTDKRNAIVFVTRLLPGSFLKVFNLLPLYSYYNYTFLPNYHPLFS